MSRPDQRQHARVKTSNLISYVCCDTAGRRLKQGMGHAVDISQNGLMLECESPIEFESISLMSVDPQDQLIEIWGTVAYSRRSPNGSYRIGIKFCGTRDENIRFAASLIKTFHYRRRKSTSQLKAKSATPD